MGDFKVLEQAKALFAENNGIGAENCIFVANKDVNSQGLQGGLRGTMGLFGGAIASQIASKDALENLFYEALLINQTEKGLGFIPLWSQGVNFNGDLGKMEAKPDNYFFIGYDTIASITVKDFSFLNRKLKKLRITFKNGQRLQVLVKLSEKKVPYHQQNFAKFMDFAARFA